MTFLNISEPAKKFLIGEISARPYLMTAFLIMSIVAGAFEMAGVGLVFPLIIVIIRPQLIEGNAYIQNLMEFLGISTHGELTVVLMVMIAVIMTIKNIYMGGFYRWQVNRIAEWKAHLANRMMRIYLYSDYQIHMEKTSSEIIRNLSLCALVFDQFILSLINIIVNLMVSLGLVTILYLTLPRETTIGILLLLSVTVIMYYGMRRIFEKIGIESNELFRARQQLIQQSLGAIKEAKILGRENYFIKNYYKIESTYYHRQGYNNFLSSIPALVIEAVIIISIMAMIGQMLLLNEARPETLAMMGVLAAAMFRLAPQANRILSSLQIINLGRNSLEIIASEIDQYEDKLKIPSVTIEEQLHDWETISLKNVSYLYPDSTKALDEVDVEFKRNEFIGITGASGAGKSTLLMLLMGLLKPSTGKLLVDDEPITDTNRLRKWQNSIGYVPQSVFLIDSSLTNNIAYCEDKEIDLERVQEVIDLVHLTEYVSEQSKGLDAPTGDSGARMSGGQLQRVGIARALYRNPELLAFDEVTSALDAKVEEAIISSLTELIGQKTIVAISHKMPVLKKCDRIIMMDRGRVLDFGTFDELKDRCAKFRELVDLATI